MRTRTGKGDDVDLFSAGTKSGSSSVATLPSGLSDSSQAGSTVQTNVPDFRALLREPLVKERLPPDFLVEVEAEHLNDLWRRSEALRKYAIEAFVHAGGSGMVFRALDSRSQSLRALKIARHKLFQRTPADDEAIPSSLSPVSPTELMGLERVSHPNSVRLFEALELEEKVYGIATTYIENPMPFDSFIRSTLERRSPDRRPSPASEMRAANDRLVRACVYIAKRLIEVADALAHMHSREVFHFDVKPANILIGKGGVAHVTDMGASVHGHQLIQGATLRVHFSWPYAHADLTSIASDPGSISGGGLKASALIKPDSSIARFDLYALGKTVLELLGILEIEFGERCYATYAFTYLHLIGALLLDGRNQQAPAQSDGLRGVRIHDRYFASDVALDYPAPIFTRHAIHSATELRERLGRMPGVASWQIEVPELAVAQSQAINLGGGVYGPYTDRVKGIVEHPAFQRLKREPQLGWVAEVYPGATHNRWSHSIGVFSCLVDYYRRLLDDTESPALRVLVDAADVEHALVAGLLHDIGQTAFGHDFEAASHGPPDHKGLVAALVADKNFGATPLADVIKTYFDVDMARVLAILGTGQDVGVLRPVDGVAKDCIDGPIDADKLDYTHRDSVYCGVSYGLAVDRERFLQSLTVGPARGKGGQWELGLSFKSKGRPAIESLLIARYQLYGSVYWHHTFRCIQSMFVHAVGLAFSQDRTVGNRAVLPSKWILDKFFYHRVVCRRPWSVVMQQEKLRDKTKDRKIQVILDAVPPADVAAEPALDYVWRCSSESGRGLIEMLGSRRLFKRIFEVRAGALGRSGMYKEIREAFPASARVEKAKLLQTALFDAIQRRLKQKKGASGVTEDAARNRYDELAGVNRELVVIDFPVRGVSSEENFPNEVLDHARKYFVIDRDDSVRDDDVFFSIRGLQEKTAMFRVYVHPDLHEIIARYLKEADIRACVEDLVPGMRPRR